MDTFPPLRFYSFVIHSIDAWRLRHSYILPNIVTSTVPAINKLDLTDATFIIPICVESTDRLLNSNITLRYLDRYLKTNIIIYEIGEKPYLSDTVESLSSDLKIEYIYDPISSVFHRTRFLNSMLSKVKTAITVNYDIDVLLTPGDYRTACDAILARNSLVYPYQFGQSLVKISDKEKKRICQDLRLPDSASDGTMLERAEYGYCQFFNTQDYKDGGMENEDFVLWGREDIERYNRFQKLWYSIFRMPGKVYHLEHIRTVSSRPWGNPYFRHNGLLLHYLDSLTPKELREYYKNCEYLKKY